MDHIKRAKLNVEVLNDAYQERYKRRMRVYYEEEFADDGKTLLYLVIVSEALLFDDKKLVQSFKVAADQLKLENGNIFSSVLLRANTTMRDKIVQVALGIDK